MSADEIPAFVSALPGEPRGSITLRKQWDVETTTESGHTYRLNYSPPLTEDEARHKAARFRVRGEDARAVFQWVSDWYPAETDK